jgi:hypothetical protein
METQAHKVHRVLVDQEHKAPMELLEHKAPMELLEHKAQLAWMAHRAL